MEIFLSLLFKLIPLYIIIFLGFLAGRYLNVKKEPVASLLIYTIVPVVVLFGIIQTEISAATLSIPVLFFIVSASISIISYLFLGLIWKDYTRNILSLAAGSANIGYFGLPVAVAIFGEIAIGIVALAILGISLYNNTFGFFIAAIGNHTAKESILKVLKLPVIYAFIVGLMLNVNGVQIDGIFQNMQSYFNGAFTVLGMMIIGIAIGECKKFAFDFKFVLFTLMSAFIVWPLLMLGIILIDQNTVRLYHPELYKIFILLSLTPIAANIVAYAAILENNARKASLAVLINTLFALFYIPLIVALFF